MWICRKHLNSCYHRFQQIHGTIIYAVLLSKYIRYKFVVVMISNDLSLIGHPKTKAFIAHGGTNGIYEAIYHGVPVVGIPLLGDQSDNLCHMKTKGAAVMLEFNKMESKDLKDALTEVINNPS